MTVLLQAKIATILDMAPGRSLGDAKIVLNIGSIRGVKAGMAFGDANAQTVEITDPDSGEILDNLPRYEWRLIVDSVRERVAICHITGNYVMYSIGPGMAVVEIRE